jgi:sulfur-oxidizing protein SoxB
MNRREFLQVLAVAGAGGMTFPGGDAQAAQAAQKLYDVPRFGNVHLLHFTDCHAQLRPVHFREPSMNLGVAEWAGRPPHLVGDAFLREYGIAPGSAAAHAFTYLDFTAAAQRYGKVGGFAYLSTLIQRV